MLNRGSIFIGSEKGSFLSDAIRKVSHSNWSHCAIITDSTEFETYVLGARGKGVDLITLTSYNHYENYYYNIYNINLPQEKIDASLRWTLDTYIEKTYGYFELLGFWIWYKLQDWFHITLKWNPISFWMVCSELNAIYFKKVFEGMGLEVDNWNPDIIAPEHIYQFILKHPELFILEKQKTI